LTARETRWRLSARMGTPTRTSAALSGRVSIGHPHHTLASYVTSRQTPRDGGMGHESERASLWLLSWLGAARVNDIY
jgi:hypothetical protein